MAFFGQVLSGGMFGEKSAHFLNPPQNNNSAILAAIKSGLSNQNGKVYTTMPVDNGSPGRSNQVVTDAPIPSPSAPNTSLSPPSDKPFSWDWKEMTDNQKLMVVGGGLLVAILVLK